jgi:hypothetical protein
MTCDDSWLTRAETDSLTKIHYQDDVARYQSELSRLKQTHEEQRARYQAELMRYQKELADAQVCF